MKKISVVTAKVVRENKIVGKGEKYIVLHEDCENAGDKVVNFTDEHNRSDRKWK